MLQSWYFNHAAANASTSQNHYIERLYKLYLYCAPTIFYGLWKVLAPLVSVLHCV